MEYLTHILAILGIILLCVCWGLLQFLARYMKTKNHFDHQGEGCGHCAKYNEGICETNCKEKGDLYHTHQQK